MNTRSYHRIYPIGLGAAVASAALLAVGLGIYQDSDKPLPPQQLRIEAPQREAARLPQPSNPLPALIAAELKDSPAEDAVMRLYGPSGYMPLWIESKEGVRRQRDLAQAATIADAQGIDTTHLSQLLLTASAKHTDAQDAARTDIALTREALDLSNALRLGVVPRKTLGSSWLMPADSFDPVPGLAGALNDKGALKDYMNALAPQHRQFKELIAALQTYRDIVEQGGWPEIAGDTEIKLDKDDPRTEALKERLAAEGYLKHSAPVDTGALTDAVKAYQARNGLEPDGRIGRGTLAALKVSAEERVQQIAANLERWRQTPRDRGTNFIAVNAASTTLDVIKDGESQLHLKVVTGTKRHATPIMRAKISAITLNPRWEIPPSIASKEILPKLQKNPNYLLENNMVVVGEDADPHGLQVDWTHYEGKVLNLRFRQRAGDDNALGLLKFQMGNPQNIYLHDTPSRGFFAKAERHLSHGCVRVERPTTLAEVVLRGTDGDWDAAKIENEIATRETKSVVLKQPLPVWIHYWTVFSENGQVQFRHDIYERDAPLAAALGTAPALAAETKASPRTVAAN